MTTIEELFAAGGHRTIEALIVNGKATIPEIAEGLAIRFAGIYAVPMTTLGIAVGRVQDAMAAAQLINAGQRPLDVEFGVNPAQPANFAYTVIASVEDPRNPGHPVEIPWTVYSPTPLEPAAVDELATQELNQFTGPRDSLPGGGSEDLRVRDRRFQEIRQQDLGGRAEPIITVLSAYRRNP